MKTITGLNCVAAISLVLIVPSAAQGGFPKETNCDRGTVNETTACIQDQADAWNDSLDDEFDAALKRVTKSQRPLLLKAQRLWGQYREANCQVQFAHGGAISGYLGEQCILNLTRERAKELHELHSEDDN